MGADGAAAPSASASLEAMCSARALLAPRGIVKNLWSSDPPREVLGVGNMHSNPAPFCSSARSFSRSQSDMTAASSRPLALPSPPTSPARMPLPSHPPLVVDKSAPLPAAVLVLVILGVDRGDLGPATANPLMPTRLNRSATFQAGRREGSSLV